MIPGSSSDPLMVKVLPLLVCPYAKAVPGGRYKWWTPISTRNQGEIRTHRWTHRRRLELWIWWGDRTPLRCYNLDRRHDLRQTRRRSSKDQGKRHRRRAQPWRREGVTEGEGDAGAWGYEGDALVLYPPVTVGRRISSGGGAEADGDGDLLHGLRVMWERERERTPLLLEELGESWGGILTGNEEGKGFELCGFGSNVWTDLYGLNGPSYNITGQTRTTHVSFHPKEWIALYGLNGPSTDTTSEHLLTTCHSSLMAHLPIWRANTWCARVLRAQCEWVYMGLMAHLPTLRVNTCYTRAIKAYFSCFIVEDITYMTNYTCCSMQGKQVSE